MTHCILQSFVKLRATVPSKETSILPRNRDFPSLADLLVLLCFTMFLDGFPITVSGSGKPSAGATRLCRNGAITDGGPFVFTKFYKDSALGFTSFPGASPTHGQGTVTVSAHRHTEFALFYNDFGSIFDNRERIWETVSGTQWDPCKNTRILILFCTFPRVPPTAPGACAIRSMLRFKR